MTDAATSDTETSGAHEPVSLEQARALLGLTLSDRQLESLRRYLSLLLEANQRVNLTAIRDPGAAESRLLSESLAIVPLLSAGATRLLDVGTGGGIPAIPLAIARPDLSVDALDATAKKVDAVTGFARELGLDHFTAHHGRAEERAHDPVMRSKYGIVVSRAVARLPTLVELTLPFLAPGGQAIFPKGSDLHDEVNEAREAIMTLGGRVQEIIESPVNAASFVIVEQLNPTPARYPRRPGTPARQPIGVPTR